MALQFYLTTHALRNGEHAIRVSVHIAITDKTIRESMDLFSRRGG